jgi:hypothetical protein
MRKFVQAVYTDAISSIKDISTLWPNLGGRATRPHALTLRRDRPQLLVITNVILYRYCTACLSLVVELLFLLSLGRR